MYKGDIITPRASLTSTSVGLSLITKDPSSRFENPKTLAVKARQRVQIGYVGTHPWQDQVKRVDGTDCYDSNARADLCVESLNDRLRPDRRITEGRYNQTQISCLLQSYFLVTLLLINLSAFSLFKAHSVIVTTASSDFQVEISTTTARARSMARNWHGLGKDVEVNFQNYLKPNLVPIHANFHIYSKPDLVSDFLYSLRPARYNHLALSFECRCSTSCNIGEAL